MALSEEKKEQVKADFEAGELPVTEIAKRHSVSRATIARLEKKYSWKRKRRPKQKPPKKKEVSKGGRPEKYNPEWNSQVTALCLLGHTDVQLAEFLEVDISNFYRWKKRHSEFRNALLNGREKAVSQVVVNLFQRANGYSHPETRVTPGGKKVEIVKHYPPEVRAIALILKSKYPKIWSDTVKVEAKIEHLDEEIDGEELEKMLRDRGIPIPEIGIEGLPDCDLICDACEDKTRCEIDEANMEIANDPPRP